MTDTAQSLPSETDSPETEDGELTPDQKQRAAALTEARFILAATGGIFGGQKLSERFTVQDLLTVGDYILGVGPFVPLLSVSFLPEASPENKADGQPVPDAFADDTPTDVLPSYPEDALPR